jgi:N-alpha-acetyltransferase 40
MGWNEAEKRGEVFNPLSRFLLAHAEESRLAGFSIFRFEEEDGENLIYW